MMRLTSPPGRRQLRPDVHGSRVCGQAPLQVVERTVLEDQYRVGVLQRCPQHAAGVGQGGGREHLDAGDVGVPALQAVGVLGGDLAAGPVVIRMTSGTLHWPPDMCSRVAALFMIWSSASRLKLTVMISTMGRIPAIAAPIPAPTKADSDSGVSLIRSGPNSSSRPRLTAKQPP